MDKKHCAGCYNDDYNRGLGGANECWSLATAKREKRILIHVDRRPPYSRSEAKMLPTCYKAQRFLNVKPDALTAAGYLR